MEENKNNKKQSWHNQQFEDLNEQLKDPNLKPDLLLTRLDELPRVFAG